MKSGGVFLRHCEERSEFSPLRAVAKQSLPLPSLRAVAKQSRPSVIASDSEAISLFRLLRAPYES
ncbi:MAG: hypothetical protein ACPLPS_00735 [bacterium]